MDIWQDGTVGRRDSRMALELGSVVGSEGYRVVLCVRMAVLQDCGVVGWCVGVVGWCDGVFGWCGIQDSVMAWRERGKPRPLRHGCY